MYPTTSPSSSATSASQRRSAPNASRSRASARAGSTAEGCSSSVLSHASNSLESAFSTGRSEGRASLTVMLGMAALGRFDELASERIGYELAGLGDAVESDEGAEAGALLCPQQHAVDRAEPIAQRLEV